MLCIFYHNKKEKQVKSWGKVYHVNTNQKKTKVSILISGKVDHRARKIYQEYRGCYIMIKR